MTKIKQFFAKFKKWIITFFIGATVFAAGTQMDMAGTPPIAEDNSPVILQELTPQDHGNDILFQGTFKLTQIDSINGQLVVVEKDEPIIVGKDFYNNCRNRGQAKAECMKEIQDRVADEIERSRERALEEIEMLETPETDYSGELSEEDKQFIK